MKSQRAIVFAAHAVALCCFVSTPLMADEATKKLSLDVTLADSTLPANQRNKSYLKVGLTGPHIEAQERPAANVALVIDQSASMQGAKIAKAKEAAVDAIQRLRPNDVLAVVCYHDGVQVVLPATKLRDKAAAVAAVQSITAQGSTALFAGISKGAAEVRKNADDYRVSRILLLSDGRANVGPNSPTELGKLGASLLRERIAVTTLGLGLDFNEDLMTELSMHSNGNHFFVEKPSDLVPTFRHEFDDILSVVAQRILIDIELREDVRAMRVLGYDADIHGQHIAAQLNQIYAEQERFLLIELDVPPSPSGTTREVANVTVEYVNMVKKGVERMVKAAHVQFSDNPNRLAAATNTDVAEKAALLVANENNWKATRLRDQGKIAEARRVLNKNYDFLTQKANELNSALLTQQRILNHIQAMNISAVDWNRTRKLMMRDNTAVAQQASGYGGNSSAASRNRNAVHSSAYSAYGSGYPAIPTEAKNSQLIKIPTEPAEQTQKAPPRQKRRNREVP